MLLDLIIDADIAGPEADAAATGATDALPPSPSLDRETRSILLVNAEADASLVRWLLIARPFELFLCALKVTPFFFSFLSRRVVASVDMYRECFLWALNPTLAFTIDSLRRM